MLDASSKALPSLVLVAPSRAKETWFLPCRGAGGGVALLEVVVQVFPVFQEAYADRWCFCLYTLRRAV